ncbi:MAG TPA: hypothetical protein VFU60_06490 [Ktedonobacterales bacterium]|nr:hypothetical protein [Ktedonobacterales bacterium]
MAKRTSAATNAPASATTRTRRSRANVSQAALPGMAETPLTPTPRAQRATPAVSLRVAPTSGPRQPARQEPATPAAKAPAAPAEQPGASQPRRTRKPNGKRIGDLRQALADGWEIVQPIFARPLWSATDDSQTAYNFVLRREQATRLLTIPDSRTVERFIAAHSLAVDSRR